jgi:sugar phosphate isomerase/epimerase
MPETTRRNFMAMAGCAAAAGFLPLGRAEAMPLGLPPGLQLYAVRDDLARDFAGTLRALRAMGYRRVEAAGWGERSAADFRAAVSDAGLDCVSCHYSLPALMDGPEAKLDFARAVGVRHVVVSSPAPSRPMPQGRPWVVGMAEIMTLADWRANAESLNRLAALAHARGLRFGYHNHAAEFLAYDNVVAFHELARLTDPALVGFEIDIGWVAAAGRDPVEVIRHHGPRVRLLHVKDIATRARTPGRIADDLTTVPVGQGTIAWPAVFAAARRYARVDAWFVEQEPPFTQPPLEAMRASLAFLSSQRG